MFIDFNDDSDEAVQSKVRAKTEAWQKLLERRGFPLRDPARRSFLKSKVKFEFFAPPKEEFSTSSAGAQMHLLSSSSTSSAASAIFMVVDVDIIFKSL